MLKGSDGSRHECDRGQARRAQIEAGNPLAAIRRRRQWSHGRRINWVVNLGVEAPIHIFGNSGTLLLFLGVLKDAELRGENFRPFELAVQPVELIVRSRQPRARRRAISRTPWRRPSDLRDILKSSESGNG